MYRSYYGDVTEVEQEGEHGVRFSFKSANNRELPQIIGEMPVLSKEILVGPRFRRRRRSTRRSAAAPTRSHRSIPGARSPIAASRIIGARICRSTRAATMSIRSATTITATPRSRSKPSRPGNTISGRRIRRRPGPPATTARPCATGLIKKSVIPNQLPSGMQGFGYNLRRPIFQDPRVREALAYAFDFEWSNKNLFYGALHPHAQLFRQFRAGRDRGAAGRGTEDPRTIPRPDPRRGLHQGIRPAALRRLRRTSATVCARRSRC